MSGKPLCAACAICDSPEVISKNLCKTCYKYSRKLRPKTFRERFMAGFRVRDNGCWEWINYTDPDGYGKTNFRRKNQQAHRASWTLHNGPIPPNLCVLHTCDNPPCVNPLHLWLGTTADNNRDREKKGRGADRRGMKGAMAKLIDNQVLEIRELLKKGMSHNNIAQQFSVTHATIGKISLRETWKHI